MRGAGGTQKPAYILSVMFRSHVLAAPAERSAHRGKLVEEGGLFLFDGPTLVDLGGYFN